MPKVPQKIQEALTQFGEFKTETKQETGNANFNFGEAFGKTAVYKYF